MQSLLYAGRGGARIDRGGVGFCQGLEYSSGRFIYEGASERETDA